MKRRAGGFFLSWLAFFGGFADYTWVMAVVKMTLLLNN
jgi:hypothetical protein